ncbi:MAG: hypothetical protein IJY62_04220 [Clostridia bacterium]|nr:hypothetical protein [Clostridia bacterium]
MKNISNRSASAVAKIHSLAFTLFFIFDTLLNEFLYPVLERELSSRALRIFITAVIAASLYAALYALLRVGYDFISAKRDKKLNIGGTWYHVHIPHNLDREDYSKNELRAGVTKISRDLYDFTFVANNYYYSLNPDGSLKVDHRDDTHWYTKATKLSDENDFDLIQIYEAKTKNNAKTKLASCPCCQTQFSEPLEIALAEKFRHGIHKLDIIEEDGRFAKPMKITGEFSDCWPSLKSGDILFFRNEQERDERIREFFENAKAAREQGN